MAFYLEEGPGLRLRRHLQASLGLCGCRRAGGGYLGTGQSGKHLIATLRRGM